MAGTGNEHVHPERHADGYGHARGAARGIAYAVCWLRGQRRIRGRSARRRPLSLVHRRTRLDASGLALRRRYATVLLVLTWTETGRLGLEHHHDRATR